MSQGSLEVPVDALRRGLYVVALDRPWTDTPFIFQGFRIGSEKELATLRKFCERVTVDVERSEGSAVARLRTHLAGAREAAQAPTARDRARAFGDSPFPRRQRFREMVRVAHEARSHARNAVDAALHDTRLGHAVYLPSLRDAVGKMTRSVVGNASAALWLTTLKDRSEYTAIHCLNVCILSLAFGRHLELEESELRTIGLGALLHDVGKARTPLEILEKPGALTKEEFEIVKRHPEDGYRMISKARHVPKTALDIIRLHHERMRGGGYPLGVRGRQIPRPVRIVAIADAYDAMTSDRSYQDARSPDTALRILYEERAERFDEGLVEQFIRCIGIYPVGSLVELDTGVLGVVVATNPNAQLQPTLLLLRTPDGKPFEKRLLVNLAASTGGAGEKFGHRIVRGLDPASAGINPAEIAGAEFGLRKVPTA
ncbi:MAG: HD-GYP domain-containing protein [Halofilum sp. (in: g-proteobacteria)]|nr:HD-GYP domain-containing protein [Halofilum sp. (in: g-proteobacteria)]